MTVSSQVLPAKERYKRLIQFLSIFNNPDFKAGEWIPAEKDSDGELQMPWVYYNDEVLKFIKICYEDRVVIDFSWPAWGEKAQALYRDASLLDKANLVTLRRLLTLHLRQDRFCDGHLLDMFESGHIAKILKRIKEICEKSRPPIKARRPAKHVIK